MRTLEEIKADMDRAAADGAVTELHELAQEAISLGTAEAQIEAAFVLGTAAEIASDYPAALQQYELARTLSIEKDIPFDAARYHHKVGMVYSAQGDFARALESHRAALAIREEHGDHTGAAGIFNSIGRVHFEMGDYSSALQHHQRALALFEDRKDPRRIANTLVHIGNVHFVTDDYPRALEYYLRALRMQEELGQEGSTAIVTGNIGMVYKATGEYEQALEHYERAMALYESNGERAGIAHILGTIGSLHGLQLDHERALSCYKQSLRIRQEIGDSAGVASTLGNIATELIKLGRNTEASEMLDEQAAMTIYQPGTRAIHHANRATLHERAGGLDAAHEELLRALQIAEDAGRRAGAAAYHLRLRDLALLRNDLAGYVEHNTEYLRITGEIVGSETTQRIMMLQAERQNEAERREREKERALLYGALPESVAQRMLRGEDVTGDHYDAASVLFLDIVGFTEMSDKLPPNLVVRLLDEIFSALDEVTERCGLMKIKTIGDSYMAIAIESKTENQRPNTTDAVTSTARAAVQMLETLAERHPEIRVRIGIHVGPVTAGVIGKQRLQYDVWGDTVNVASRMESTGEPGRIHVSEAFAFALDPHLRGEDDDGPDSLTSDSLTLFKRGITDVKGKGPMTTYWLESA